MELRKQTLRHGKMHISIILTRSKNLYVTKTLDILYPKIHKRGKKALFKLFGKSLPFIIGDEKNRKFRVELALKLREEFRNFENF